MNEILLFIAGVLSGLVAAFIFRHATDEKKNQQVHDIVTNIKSEFGSLSLQALSSATGEFLKLANEKLKNERELGSGELEKKKR